MDQVSAVERFTTALNNLYHQADKPEHSELIRRGKPAVVLKPQTLSDWILGHNVPTDGPAWRFVLSYLQAKAQRRSAYVAPESGWEALRNAAAAERRRNRGGRPPTAHKAAPNPTGSPAATPKAAPPQHQAASWPVRVGAVPTLASAFQARDGLRAQVEAARTRGTGVVLTQVLAGGGGVGKSQLAAFYADQAARAGTDLVVWVDSTQPEAIPAAYAQAATRVGAPGANGSDADADAHAFLAWLADTPRSWLVTFDDITDPDQVGPWWPTSHTGTGWVLATTRRRDAVFSGGGRVVVAVDVYGPDESATYLRDRLTDASVPHLLDTGADRLATELGHLPLALSHAAAYMINQQLGCDDYLKLFTDRKTRLGEVLPADADTERYGRQVAVTLLLAVDAAQACNPAGLALPALRLAAALDPAGHPDTLSASPPVTAYLTAHRTPTTSTEPEPNIETEPATTDVAPGQARAALLLLHRYGLATFDGPAGPRAVRIHALTARAAREVTPTADLPAILRAGADALLAVWPVHDHIAPELIAALRANTDILTSHATDVLWHPDGHLLLYRAGTSLLNAGLHTAAVAHWQRIGADAMRLLGAKHPDTLTARANLAAAYQQAGRTADAITIQEQVATETMQLLGPEHPDTLTARANLAVSYWQAGRTADAITIEEQVAADTRRLLGPEHPRTLTARANLAVSYRHAGRTADAITILEQVATETMQLLGPEHPRTLTARANLAVSYQQAGRTADAITILEQVATEIMQLLGPEHPDTLTARANLAVSYQQAGRTADAITIQEQVATDRIRLLGPEHPDTLTARANLAVSYQQAGRTADAITIQEQVATETMQLLGPEHPTSLAVLTALREWTNGG